MPILMKILLSHVISFLSKVFSFPISNFSSPNPPHSLPSIHHIFFLILPYMQVSDIHQFHTRSYGYMQENMDFIINSISMTSNGGDGYRNRNAKMNFIKVSACQFLLSTASLLGVTIYIRI